MIAAVHQPLTPQQEHILSTLLQSWTEPAAPGAHSPSLPALARTLSLSLNDLLEELQVLAPHLESIADLSRLESTLHAARARRIAIDTLADIAADTESDPIERRRAATAVLRATAVPRQSAPTPSSPNAECRLPSAAPPPIAPLPASPQELTAHILSALANNDDPQSDHGLATLHACFAPNATLNDEPVADDLDDFLDDLDDDYRDVLTNRVQCLCKDRQSTSDTYTERVTLVQNGGRCHSATIHLCPAPVPPHPTTTEEPPQQPSGAQLPHPDSQTHTDPSTQTAATWRIHTFTIKPIETGFR